MAGRNRIVLGKSFSITFVRFSTFLHSDMKHCFVSLLQQLNDICIDILVVGGVTADG